MPWKFNERPVSRVVSSDADELSVILSEQFADVRVRPLDGAVDFYCELTAYWDGFLIEDYWRNGGMVEPIRGSSVDMLLLSLPLQGGAEFVSGARSVTSSRGMAALVDLAGVSRFVHSAKRRSLGVCIARGEVIQRLSDLIERPVDWPLDLAENIDLTDGVGQMLIAMAAGLRASLATDTRLLQSRIAMSQVKSAFIAVLLEGVPHRLCDELRKPVSGVSPYYVKRAVEYMWANASRPISAAEIAAECGVGVRALQSGFTRFKSMPMMAYLREIRLNAVRKELHGPCGVVSIADTAQKWGFTHLGRFSSEYEKRFGELPSQTRRRAVGAGPNAS